MSFLHRFEFVERLTGWYLDRRLFAGLSAEDRSQYAGRFL